MSLNPGTDWKFFDFARAITMKSVRTSNPPDVTTSVANAFRGAVRYSVMMQTNGAYARPEASYLIPMDASNTGGAGPWKPGDKLTDANEQDPTQQTPTPVVYTVQTATNDGYYWYLTVFNPKIVYNLRDLINVIVRTEGTGPTHDATFATEASNLICRRQLRNAEMVTYQGRQGTRKTYDIYLADVYAFDPKKHSITWTEGSDTITADIQDINNTDDITQLQSISVHVNP